MQVNYCQNQPNNQNPNPNVPHPQPNPNPNITHNQNANVQNPNLPIYNTNSLPVYEDLMAPVQNLPFTVTQSGKFSDAPGVTYEPPPAYEELPGYYQTQNQYYPSTYQSDGMELRIIQVVQPDGTIVEQEGWVPKNFNFQ